jgi:hypothetical protein
MFTYGIIDSAWTSTVVCGTTSPQIKPDPFALLALTQHHLMITFGLPKTRKEVTPMWTSRFRIRPVSHCKEGCSI